MSYVVDYTYMISYCKCNALDTVPVFFLFEKTTKLGYANANSAKDLTSFQMSLSLTTHTRASCQSLLRISMTLCMCFLFCSPPQCHMSFGDFTQQELWVSHLHFLSYCVDRAGSVKEGEKITLKKIHLSI